MKTCTTLFLLFIGVSVFAQPKEDQTLEDWSELYFNHPFRNMDSLDYPTGSNYVDSIRHLLLNDSKKIQITTKEQNCLGDYCLSYRYFKDQSNGIEAYYFKNDSGDYGFGNHQFILKNGIVQYARNFDISIEEFPSDTNETLWKMEENIFDIAESDQCSTATLEFTGDWYDHLDMKGAEWEVTILPSGNISGIKKEELQDLLNFSEEEKH